MRRIVVLLLIVACVLCSPVSVDAAWPLKLNSDVPVPVDYSWESFCSDFMSTGRAQSIISNLADEHDLRIRRARRGETSYPRIRVGCNSVSDSAEALVLITMTLERPVVYRVGSEQSATIYTAPMHGGIGTGLIYASSTAALANQLPKTFREVAGAFYLNIAEAAQESGQETKPLQVSSEELVSGTGLEVANRKILNVYYESCSSLLPDLKPAIRTASREYGITVRFINHEELKARGHPPAAVIYCQASSDPTLYYYYVIYLSREISYGSGSRAYRASATSPPQLVMGTGGSGLLEAIFRVEKIKQNFLSRWSVFLQAYLATNR